MNFSYNLDKKGSLIKTFFLIALSISVLFGATITSKTVGCETLPNLKKALELQGSKHFIKFLVMGKCQVLQKNSTVSIINEQNEQYQIRALNRRELWINKNFVSK